MRTLVVLGILLVFFLASGIYVQHYLVETGAQLSQHMQTVLEAARVGHWAEAAEQTRTVQELWDRVGQRWNYFTEHEEIDDINGALSRMHAYVMERDTAGTLSEGEAALHLFQHVPEKEAITLANIF